MPNDPKREGNRSIQQPRIEVSLKAADLKQPSVPIRPEVKATEQNKAHPSPNAVLMKPSSTARGNEFCLHLLHNFI